MGNVEDLMRPWEGPTWPAPAVVVPVGTPLAALAMAPNLRPALAEGLPVVVVGDDGAPRGVLSPEVIAEVMADHLSDISEAVGPTLSDPEISGEGPRSVGGFNIECRVCGRHNHFDEEPPKGQLCVDGGHKLTWNRS
jgi:hypothetical protein